MLSILLGKVQEARIYAVAKTESNPQHDFPILSSKGPSLLSSCGRGEIPNFGNGFPPVHWSTGGSGRGEIQNFELP
jgi:hypothetical protein